MNGFYISVIEKLKSPPTKLYESNPLETTKTAPDNQLTDSKLQEISSENPLIEVQDEATLVGSEIYIYYGIVILTTDPLAIGLFAGVVPIIVKLL